MRRGFSLVELLVVVSLTAMMAAPFCGLYLMYHREAVYRARLSASRQEARALAWRIFHQSAQGGGYRVDSDNHGLTFKDGSWLRWDGQRLMAKRGNTALPATDLKFQDFIVIKRQEKVWLTMVVRYQGVDRPQLYRCSWGEP